MGECPVQFTLENVQLNRSQTNEFVFPLWIDCHCNSAFEGLVLWLSG